VLQCVAMCCSVLQCGAGLPLAVGVTDLRCCSGTRKQQKIHPGDGRTLQRQCFRISCAQCCSGEPKKLLEKGENRKNNWKKQGKHYNGLASNFRVLSVAAQCRSSVLHRQIKKSGRKGGEKKKIGNGRKNTAALTLLICVGPVLQHRKECKFKIKNQNKNTWRRQKRRCNARATDLRWPVVVGVVAAAVAGVVAAAVGVA